ncbi:reverse transcriptase domain-containing protein [Tanacetum coccineum]
MAYWSSLDTAYVLFPSGSCICGSTGKRTDYAVIFLDGYCVLDVRTIKDGVGIIDVTMGIRNIYWLGCPRGWEMGSYDARPERGVDGPLCNGENAEIAEAIEEYEKTRANPDNAGGSGLANTGGIVAPNFEKMKQVFEISKCAEDDKVRFEIPWSNVKTMMTTEYCPATEIQRMEQELWNHTMKGDDIEAYNNRFYELALMCPDLVTPKKKKIERYIRGLPERVKV